jgi:hypothetical protein
VIQTIGYTTNTLQNNKIVNLFVIIFISTITL